MATTAIPARVIYDFEGQADNNEITVYEHELVTVVCEDVGEGWVEAVKENGEQGLVPASYIDYDEYEPPGPVHDEWSEPPPPPPADTGVQFAEQPAPGGVQFVGQPAPGDNEWSDYDSDEDQHSRQTRPSVSLDVDDESRAAQHQRSNTMKKSMNRFTPYVKSGAEDFILGKDKEQIAESDTITIICPNNIDLCWQPNQIIAVEITEPIKKAKFKGMKSFMSYHITPNTTNLTVERRYKQFDWFHGRLTEKFPCFIIPPLPEKAVVGKYQQDFIEQRRDKLELFLNRIGRHPIISNCNVTNHFLKCQDDKDWKDGKRKAESDKTARSGFFMTVKCEGPLPDNLSSESYVGSFSTFSKKMEGTLDKLVKQNEDYAGKMTGGIKHMYSKYGHIFKELGELYDTGPLSDSKPVNVALMGTGRCYQEISEVYENQPRYDAHVLSESVREYQGMLSSVPDMLHVHKGAAQKVKDYTQREGEKDVEEEAKVLQRYSTISAAVMSEINHFHTERNRDFNFMVRGFIASQIDFHKNILLKLENALNQYPDPSTLE
ncbi:sorting nexin-18-like isoform X2 [Bolinopsis microptera]|uniref:sorting nexin-18-like isoform X2 n=1 Tax=Bolinopsis microptera TaxID=2820187 RepID=UPI00307A191A